jgi:hypothetical protein
MLDVQVYVDGQVESYSAVQDAAIDTMGEDSVRLGMRAGDSWMLFNGLLDELCLYSRVLTPEEIVRKKLSRWPEYQNELCGAIAPSSQFVECRNCLKSHLFMS